MPHNTAKVINKTQILIGAIALLLGLLFYLIARPPETTYFLTRFTFLPRFHQVFPEAFAFFGNWLPDFLHIFSFILTTAGIIHEKKAYLPVTLGWLMIECAFELGQKYNTYLLKIIPDWFSGIPTLEAVNGFFSRGTFDPYDLIAFCAGATMAYWVLLLTTNMPRRT